jgi:hypothetical protein
MAKVPNLFILGAQKCGTTSTYRFLVNQESISGPSLKEPNFLSFDRSSNDFGWKISNKFYRHNRIFSVEDYINLYSAASDGFKFIVDGSASYLYGNGTADAIKAISPDARLIVLLRNPIDRAFSEFAMQRSIGREISLFRKAIEAELHKGHADLAPLDRRYIWHGRYDLHLKSYLQIFDRSAIHIDCVDMPGETMGDVFRRIAAFLGLTSPLENIDQRENVGSQARYPCLNNLLYWTGAKALIARAGHPALKKRAKKFYYRPSISMPRPEDRAKLWSCGLFNIDRVEAMTGLVLEHWKNDRDRSTGINTASGEV